jgi:hypothetical protein
MNVTSFKRKLYAFLFVALQLEPAAAQMLIQADLALLQPQISRDETGFRSCGVRAVVMSDDTQIVEAYDFSLMVDARHFVGMLKAGKRITTKAQLLKGDRSNKVVMPLPIKFWIAREAEGKAISPQKVVPSETKGFILGIADIAQTYEGIFAIIHGERMQFAVRYKEQLIDVVISFVGEMSEVERNSLLICLNGIVERMRAETK